MSQKVIVLYRPVRFARPHRRRQCATLLAVRPMGADRHRGWLARQFSSSPERPRSLERFHLLSPEPNNWRSVHQHETPTIAGADASCTLTGALAGVPTEHEIGVQTRFDAINLLLTDTYQRGWLSTIRQDYVKEDSIGVYAQETAHWSDWCKTYRNSPRFLCGLRQP
jgi:hypothetical protein